MKTQQKWITAAAAATFASAISFFNVNSAWADQNNFNTGLIALGLLFAISAVVCVKKSS